MMKLLVLTPLVVAATKPGYYARLGEFCGTADNGDFHKCHGTLECRMHKCYAGANSGGSLRGYRAYADTQVKEAPHVTHYVTHHYVTHQAAPASAHHYVQHYVPAAHAVHYAPAKHTAHYSTHYMPVAHAAAHYATRYVPATHATTHYMPATHATSHYVPATHAAMHFVESPASSHLHYVTAPHHTHVTHVYSPHVTSAHATALNGFAAWTAAKPGEYTMQNRSCSAVTALGANGKPCAPWLACYAHGHVGTGVCRPKLVTIGQRCGQAFSQYNYIDVGRCPMYSHCQADAVHNPGVLGAGICAKNPLEWALDAIDIFH